MRIAKPLSTKRLAKDWVCTDFQMIDIAALLGYPKCGCWGGLKASNDEPAWNKTGGNGLSRPGI